jgi:tetratricopeptide (TPR) repeat protein
MAVYAAIVAHADSVEPTSLFSAGVSIYNAAPPLPDSSKIASDCRGDSTGTRTPTAARRRAIAAACVRVASKAMQARDSAAHENYALAARAFEAGLTRVPESRDGLYNLSNAYFALRESDKMLGVAQRLVAIDPLNRTALRLVAQAHQLKGQSDSALRYVTLADSLIPVEVTVSRFAPGDQNASLSGLVTNFHEKPSAPLSLVFEFLDAKGEAVATQTVEVPAIPAGGNHPFQVQAIGTAIVAWRYKTQ